MYARFHHRVAWIVAATLGGVAACAGGGGGATPGHDGGVAAADCLGPSWFGDLDATSRSRLVGLVCADARSGSLAPGRFEHDAGPSCKGAFTVRSDDEIEAILTALDEGEMREGALAETRATAPAVRDFGHTISSAHGRSAEQTKKSRKGRAEATDLSRSVTAGFQASEDALKGASDASFDDEFLERTVVQHARQMEMLDQLSRQAKNADTHCNLDKAREMALSHLQLACMVSGKSGEAPPTMARRRGQQQHVGQSTTGAAPCPEADPPAATDDPPAATDDPPAAERP